MTSSRLGSAPRCVVRLPLAISFVSLAMQGVPAAIWTGLTVIGALAAPGLMAAAWKAFHQAPGGRLTGGRPRPTVTLRPALESPACVSPWR
jgi:hypothetical protein